MTGVQPLLEPALRAKYEVSVNLTPRISAIPREIVGKTYTFRTVERSLFGKTLAPCDAVRVGTNTVTIEGEV